MDSETVTSFSGLAIALIGAGLATALGCAGSAIGVGAASSVGSGVTAEKPGLFGKVLLLAALPSTQGIYGFLVAILVGNKLGLLGGELILPDLWTGVAIFAAALPTGLAGLFSGIFQGKVAATGIHLIAADESATGKAVTLAAMVETYAVLGLLVTVLFLNGISL